MDWQTRLQGVKAAAKKAQDTGVQFVGDGIEEHWPTIRRVLQERIAPAVTALARDDDVVELVARGLHQHLPLPVRLVIRPKMLAGWCVKHRERILAAIRPGPDSQPGPATSTASRGRETVSMPHSSEVEQFHNAGSDAFNAGDFQRASQSYHRAYEIAPEQTSNERMFKAVIAYRYGLSLLRMSNLGAVHPREIPAERLPIANRIRELWGTAMRLLTDVDPASRRSFDEQFAPGAGKAMIADPLMRGEMAFHIGKNRADEGRKQDAAAYFCESLDLLDERVPAHTRLIAQAHVRLATLSSDLGNGKQAADHARWVLEHAPPQDETVLRIMRFLAGEVT